MFVDSATKQKLKEKYGDEMVFVVPSHMMVHIPDKFFDSAETNETLSLYDSLGQYILRHDAEMNMAFQQLIPYVIIKNKKGDKYFVAERIAGDERLVKSLSLGFGGHIDKVDGHQNVIMNALHRELEEELDITPVSEPTFVGTMRDLSSPTADHIGFVFELSVSKAKIRETKKLRGIWMTPQELVDNYFAFEGWSKFYIDELYMSMQNRLH